MYSTQPAASSASLNSMFNPMAQTFQPPMAPPQPDHSSNGKGKGPVVSEYGFGKSIRKEVNFSINKRDTEALQKFNGSINDFPDWKNRMVDHFADSTQKYRTIIEQVGESKLPITEEALKATVIDGSNSWGKLPWSSGHLL